MSIRHKAHPWHGIEPNLEFKDDGSLILTAFIEIVPSDTIKYEVDKSSGYLKIDRPQKYSNMIPTLYGFIPQTYCAEEVADYAMMRIAESSELNLRVLVKKGDGDPLDICVLSERPVTHGDILLQAVPIGGFRMIDGGEADDKIIAVMKGDEFYEKWSDITDCPKTYRDRLKHYFLTYKHLPTENAVCEITHEYGRDEAHEVIRRALADYQHHYGHYTN